MYSKLYVLILVILAIFTYCQEEQKTITLELTKKRLKPVPHDYPDINGEIYTEEDLKRRGLQTIEKTMTNYFDLQYYATLFIGDSSTSMTFIYDTGSSFLWVPLANCSCSHNPTKYTPAGSFSTDGTRDSITYGSGYVEGVVFTDNVRAVSGGTAVNLRMLGVDADTGLSGTQADGILGMTPTAYGNSELFITKLFTNGVIGLNQFGVGYRYTSSTSKIVLGGYDSSVVTNSSLFTYVDLKDTTYWSLPLNAMTYGNESVGISASRAILDTGTSLTYWSTDDWNIIYAKVTAGKT